MSRLLCRRFANIRPYKRWITDHSAPISCEERFRIAEWDEYSSLANEREFLSEYARGAYLVTKNKRLEREIQYIFGAAAFLTVALGSGYVFNNIRNNNTEKERFAQSQQEKLFFVRRNLENFTIKNVTTSTDITETITGQAELISSTEVPFQHFVRISLECNPSKRIKEPNTVRNIIIPATELSQVYTSDSGGKSFSFQSQTELQMRIKEMVINWTKNSIEIPESVATAEETPKMKKFELFEANSAAYDEFRAWVQQILLPLLSFSGIAASVSFIVAKRAWRKVCKQPDWITISIFRPWRQGILLGGKVALGTTTICSLITFGMIYSSYKTKTLFFEDPNAPEFDCLEGGSQWIQVPTLWLIFTLGSLVLSSWFVIPAGAITGRIVTGKIYQEMTHILPRSTIAVRKFTKSLKK